MLHHPWTDKGWGRGSGCDNASRQGVHHSHHAVGTDPQTGHQRILLSERRHLELTRRPRYLGRRPHSTMHGINDGKDGKRHCRQHAHHHISLDESASVRSSRHGPRHVSPSVNTAEHEYASGLWQPYHRTQERISCQRT